MGKKFSAPRKGSLQYWPRKRAKRQHARVRTWNDSEAGVLGFAGYKAGMTHVIATDNDKNSLTKGQDIQVPVTIIECPPLKIVGVRFYKDQGAYGEKAATEVRFSADKHLARTTKWSKTGDLEKIDAQEYVRATLIVHTQPHLTGIGQKKPRIFELGFGGGVQETIDFVKENKELAVADIFKEGEFVDAHAVTKGKGWQGVVKRFGVGLRSHKSEKGRRKAVIGPEGYGKVQYHAPQAGKMGYHLRTEYNKKVLGIKKPEEVQIKGGLLRYGNPKNAVLLVKGSVQGPKKRLITLSKGVRKNPKKSTAPMTVNHIATRSQQGSQ
jgi:large subunit ribosomal protein L3